MELGKETHLIDTLVIHYDAPDHGSEPRLGQLNRRL